MRARAVAYAGVRAQGRMCVMVRICCKEMCDGGHLRREAIAQSASVRWHEHMHSDSAIFLPRDLFHATAFDDFSKVPVPK